VVAVLIKPFLPATAETFYRAFNFEEIAPWETVDYRSIVQAPASRPDWKVTASLTDGKPVPLFPKILPPKEA
jgi:methionyl-tRNA synthetase